MNFSTKTPFCKAFLFSFVISAGLAPLPSATAQETTALDLEEIIVTAQRREQNVLDVPISLQVLTARDLEGMSDVRDIYKVAPTVQFQGGVSSGGQSLSIRGVGGGGLQRFTARTFQPHPGPGHHHRLNSRRIQHPAGDLDRHGARLQLAAVAILGDAGGDHGEPMILSLPPVISLASCWYWSMPSPPTVTTLFHTAGSSAGTADLISLSTSMLKSDRSELYAYEALSTNVAYGR